MTDSSHPPAGPTISSYDAVQYPGYTHPQTHPSRLAVIGELYGLSTSPVESCRVLELACGNGNNLIPMAASYPKSQFMGIDLAARQIASGQNMIAGLELTNVRLMAADILDMPGDWGRFDYIIAHGMYSWVPPEVRTRMLEICRNHLAASGIAFISYNAFPGCHVRNMLREMMLFHVRSFTEPAERVNQALAMARFLAGTQETRDEYRLWMKAELEHILEHERGHLYHDELAPINDAFYFTHFIQAAARQGLQYLGEADFFEMSDRQFAPATRETLEQLAKNRILREQYLDFVKCRRFRQTLLCHQEAKLDPEPRAEAVTKFLISSTAGNVTGETDIRPGVTAEFQTPRGAKCETDFAPGKAALDCLNAAWPVPLTFDALVESVSQRLGKLSLETSGDGDLSGQLRDFLFRLYESGMVEFRTSVPKVAGIAGERPIASPVARWQARHGEFVASLFHMAVKVEDDIGRSLLTWLDGTSDRQALLEKLWKMLKDKNAIETGDGGDDAARAELAEKLELNLKKIARYGLLMA